MWHRCSRASQLDSARWRRPVAEPESNSGAKLLPRSQTPNSKSALFENRTRDSSAVRRTSVPDSPKAGLHSRPTRTPAAALARRESLANSRLCRMIARCHPKEPYSRPPKAWRPVPANGPAPGPSYRRYAANGKYRKRAITADLKTVAAETRLQWLDSQFDQMERRCPLSRV